MKLLTAPVFFVAALVLAGLVLASSERLRRRLLRWMPPVLVPFVATVLVALGFGQEVPAQGEGPPAVSAASREGCPIDESMARARLLAPRDRRRLVELKRLLVAPATLSLRDRSAADDALRQMPEPSRVVLAAFLEGRKAGRPFVPEVLALSQALEAMERTGLVDGWYAGWFWSLSRTAIGPREDLVDFLQRVRRHLRMDEALIKAAAKVAPFSPRAWASKAGGPRPAVVVSRAKLLVLEAERQWDATADGAWNRVGRVALRVANGTTFVHVRRGATRERLVTGERFAFGRFDLIEVSTGGAVLEHEGIGRISLAEDSVATSWSLSKGLDDSARRAVDALVQRALDGDEVSVDAIEAALPLALDAIEEGLATASESKGAPVLRQLRLLHLGVPVPVEPRPDAPRR